MTRRAGQLLQALGWCHDIGREGTRSSRGDPLCSISAQAESTAVVISLLARRASEIERIHEEDHER
jgi:predicted ATP-grasp superfamily ATP-dependent carboligase